MWRSRSCVLVHVLDRAMDRVLVHVLDRAMDRVLVHVLDRAMDRVLVHVLDRAMDRVLVHVLDRAMDRVLVHVLDRAMDRVLVHVLDRAMDRVLVHVLDRALLCDEAARQGLLAAALLRSARLECPFCSVAIGSGRVQHAEPISPSPAQHRGGYMTAATSVSADESLVNELNTFFARFEPTSSSANANSANGAFGAANDACAEPTIEQRPFIITESDMRVFERVNTRKAAGPDGICGRVLKACADQLAPVFTAIFNLAVTLGIVPSGFK
ncbi:hypothetical protein P4O66_004665 [Electrophorus voltai]|uniref:Reverse transcriptase domain-containing protein n=1 Tax=Electrophorus voltai TaxID=2609070 RepID=A0AAD9E0R6_9TELE|nr:hypothetical protein P4O66_004665 [Electrophorus voltai]